MSITITTNEQETLNLAEKFSRRLTGGEVVLLFGNLGAGKTVFTKGIARGLGIKKNITSPTFVIMKVYPVKNHGSIKKLVHLDCYRLSAFSELSAIGINDYLGRKDAVVVMEWPENVIKKIDKKNKMFEKAIRVSMDIILTRNIFKRKVKII